MAGGLRICTVAGSTPIGASPVAMFLLTMNWSSMLGWLGGHFQAPALGTRQIPSPRAIAGGKTTLSGQKINLWVGQKVILNVTSDTDDEIHAHIGGPGYELPVQAGKPATGSFTLDSAGTFEVESILRIPGP